MERDLDQSSDADVTSAKPSRVFLDKEFVVFRDLPGFHRFRKRVFGVSGLDQMEFA